MTETKRLIFKAYKSKGSLCWDCKKALWGCSWSAKFIQVDGWSAIRRDVRVAEGMKTESYFVLDCPEFVHDEVRDEIDADALWEQISQHRPFDALALIEDAQTVDSIKHGHWTETYDESQPIFFKRRWVCSACGRSNTYGKPPFCMYCGAEMKGEENGKAD